MENENKKYEIYQTAKVAAKWWADRIDGTIVDIIWGQEKITVLEGILKLIKEPKLVRALSQNPEFSKVIVGIPPKILDVLGKLSEMASKGNLRDIEVNFLDNIVSTREKGLKEKQIVFPLQRKRFEQVLTDMICEQIEKDGVAYLSSNSEGVGYNILSFAADRCEIETDKKGPFTFADYFEMFVSKDKIETRYNEDDRYDTSYCTEEGWEYINKDMDKLTQGEDYLQRRILGDGYDEDLEEQKKTNKSKNDSDGRGGI